MEGITLLISCNSITLDNNVIQFVSDIKYFGFLLTFNMCNKPEIVAQRNRFYNVIIYIYICFKEKFKIQN